MLISRGAPLLRRVLFKPRDVNPVRNIKTSVQNLSGDGFRYRNVGPEGSPIIEKLTDGVFIFLWFWVCYHTITKYDHLIGEYDYPDASKWTDEELGVPPDDYEPPMRA